MKLRHPRSWSLSVKLPLTIAAAVAGVAFTIGLTVVAQERDRIRAELEEKALFTARSVASATPEALVRNDYWTLHKTLALMAARKQAGAISSPVLTGMILDAEGRVMAHLDPANNSIGLALAEADPAERTRVRRLVEDGASGVRWLGAGAGAFVEGVMPVHYNESIVGIIILRVSAAGIHERTLSASLTILGLTLALGTLGSIAGAVISSRLVRPLRALASGMQVVARGEMATLTPIPAPDRDEIGRLVESFNAMARELAEKRALEQELATGEKLVALGRIAAGVAHEVNNPLGGMLNCIDTLEKFPDDHDLFARYLPLIKKGLHRIHAIVQSLLVELRTEGSEEWGGGDCLDDLRELVVAEIAGRPIALHWDNQLAVGVCLQCRKVQQVVLNLLRNAVQALAERGTVALRAAVVGGEVVIEVEDDGIGIPLENLSRVFDPFFTSRPSGTGLGLWMTYRLVESMRGSIEVESEPGHGSLFRVRLAAVETRSAEEAGA